MVKNKKLWMISVIYALCITALIWIFKDNLRTLPAFQCQFQVIPFYSMINDYHLGVLQFNVVCKDILMNIIMYIPLVILLNIRNSSVKAQTLMVLLAAVIVNVLEYALKLGSFDMTDILFNLVGAWIISLVIVHVKKLQQTRLQKA